MGDCVAWHAARQGGMPLVFDNTALHARDSRAAEHIYDSADAEWMRATRAAGRRPTAGDRQRQGRTQQAAQNTRTRTGHKWAGRCLIFVLSLFKIAVGLDAFTAR